METNLVTQYKKIKQHYRVPHLINDNKQVIFVLESPHIDELIHQSPVSGLSGKSMTKILFPYQEDNKALGIKLKAEPENRIGIINICGIPMQKAAYINKEVIDLYNPRKKDVASDFFFNSIEDIRENPQPDYNNEEINELQSAILNDFKKEMKNLKDRTLLLIPCGKTATTFFNMSGVSSSNWTILCNTPHPSFNQWSRRNNYDHIFNMRLQINEIYWENRTINGVAMKPYEVFHALINEQNINLNQLALTLEEDYNYLVNVSEGNSVISTELADKLNKHFAISNDFWLT